MGGRDYIEPYLGGDLFTCPRCGSNTSQTWYDLRLAPPDPIFDAESYAVSKCVACEDYAIWQGEVLLYPGPRLAPFMELALPEAARAGYKMARDIYAVPPACCAVLRSVLHVLFQHLGAAGDTLLDAMHSLAARYNLSAKAQRLFAMCCVHADKPLHPGVIVPSDSAQTAHELFNLIAALLRDTGLAVAPSSPTVVTTKHTLDGLLD